MRNKAISLVLLVLACGVQAAQVTQDDARQAAAVWVSGGGDMCKGIGPKTERAVAYFTTNGIPFYAVKMQGGGTVFTSGDTDLEPIIAFTSSTNDYSTMDSSNPLWVLLNRDLIVRRAIATQGQLAEASTTNLAMTKGVAPKSQVDVSAQKWAALLSRASAPKSVDDIARTSADVPNRLTKVDDVRRAPFLKTEWSQQKAKGYNCYNLYTPNNWPCGCTATATSQLLKYHAYPKGAVASRSFECEVGGVKKMLTTQGGVYDWNAMPDKPASTTYDEDGWKEIGKLTSDVGIALRSVYTLGSTGAFVWDIPGVLKGLFGYANAVSFYKASLVDEAYDGDGTIKSSVGLHSRVVKEKTVFANLDAGYPVIFGIYGYADGKVGDKSAWEGHAVVGDGYGYSTYGGEATPYVHINMGWAGTDDAWYNIPEIKSPNSGSYIGSKGTDFTVMAACVYNAFPQKSGNIISGRVLDDEGIPAAGLTVRLSESGKSEVLDSVVTDEKGIYSFVCMGARSYDVSAVTAEGRLAETNGLYLSASVEDSPKYGVTNGEKVGNVWGVDLVAFDPTVRLVREGVTKGVYSYLNKALQMAEDGDVIEVLADAELRAGAEVSVRCTLTAVEGAFIKRAMGAALTVAPGGDLTLSNVTFSAGLTTAVQVKDGGTIRLAANVDLGVPEQVDAIVVAKADGLHFADMLLHQIAVRCENAMALNQQFAFADVADFNVASNLATKVINLKDPDGETAGVAQNDGGAPYRLVWGLVPVAQEDATAYYTELGASEPCCFRSLDKMFLQLSLVESPAMVTVAKNASLSVRVEPRYDLAILSPSGAVISNLTSAAGFVVTNGVSLSVQGLTFDGVSTGDSLFVVTGTGSHLALDGVTVRNFAGSRTKLSAAVRIVNGASATFGSDTAAVTFENCVNMGSNQSQGGAVAVLDSGLSLQGEVLVRECQSRGVAGGIYMGKGSSVALSGLLQITDNRSGLGSPIASDLYCAADAEVIVTGPIHADSRIGYRRVGTGWNLEGYAFARPSATFVDQSMLISSARGFFCDGAEATLMGKLSDDRKSFVWAEKSDEILPVDPSEAKARIRYPDGSGNYYASLKDAFSVLSGDATIEIMASSTFDGVVEIDNSVTLVSGPGGPYELVRQTNGLFQVSAGAHLSIRNLTVSGGGESGRLFVVDGGELALETGAEIRDVNGGASRSDSAVRVDNGGILTLSTGSRIINCSNTYVTSYSDNSRGGAVAADNGSVVRLLGGTIEQCEANLGGGVFVGNSSAVEVGGDVAVVGNGTAEGLAGNVYVPTYSKLTLVSPLTGMVGVTGGPSSNPDVFGSVAGVFSGTDAQLANSAHNFTNDRNGDVGFAVRNGSETLLVWSDGLTGAGTYVDANGKIYKQVLGGTPVVVEVPAVEEGLVYNGAAQRGVPEGHGYEILGCGVATNAGLYSATLRLKPGFEWADQTVAARTVSWSIEKATYDMSGVVFTNETYVYDGSAKTILVHGDLPDGVAAHYFYGDKEGGNVQTNVGSYQVVAVFSYDEDNYVPIDDRIAVLTITDDPGPIPPGPTPVPCVPFAFTSIVEASEGSWSLVISPVVKYCRYTLMKSDDLVSWSPVGEQQEATEDGEMTFAGAGGVPGRFWKVIGEDGEMPNN